MHIFNVICKITILSVFVPYMRKPSERFPDFSFFFIKKAYDLNIAEAMLWSQRNKHISYKIYCFASVSRNSYGIVAYKRNTGGYIINDSCFFDDFIGKLSDFIAFKLKTVAVGSAFDVDAQLFVSHSHTHIEIIPVGRHTFPQTTVKMRYVFNTYFGIGIFFCQNFTLNACDCFNTGFLLIDICSVFFVTHRFVLLQTFLSLFVITARWRCAADRHNKTCCTGGK